jgi:DNA-binding MarR family transcriptional regulator
MSAAFLWTVRAIEQLSSAITWDAQHKEESACEKARRMAELARRMNQKRHGGTGMEHRSVQAVLGALRDMGEHGGSKDDIAERTGLPRPTVKNRVVMLVNSGLAEPINQPGGRTAGLYRLTGRGRDAAVVAEEKTGT